ncbi:unnamed protein product, partial [Bubo scandiacus]
MVGTFLRVKASVSTEKDPEMLPPRWVVMKETSVQAVGCNECLEPSPGEKVCTCKRYAQTDDLLHQVAELQGTVQRLRSIRGAKTEIHKWFQNHVPMVNTTESEAPWTLMTYKSRTLLQSPPSSITTKTRYEALTAADTHKQGLQGGTVPATHNGYHKRKWQ